MLIRRLRCEKHHRVIKVKKVRLKNVGVDMTKLIEKSKYLNNIYRKKGVRMGVSMGVIQPMTGQVAQDFLKDSKESSITKETIKKCKELAKMITKRY